MTYDELNNIIYNYACNDKTKTAILLTGGWGTGKSHYINNTLREYLRGKSFKTIVISLYSMDSIGTLNNEVFVGHFCSEKIKDNAVINGIGVVTTAIGSAVFEAQGISIGNKLHGLEKLLMKFDMSKELVVLEDVERSKIPIEEILGYVNTLCEYNGAKVLLVANEEEIVKGTTEKKSNIIYKDDESLLHSSYLRIKEKTISDTVLFNIESRDAVKHILEDFGFEYTDKRYDCINRFIKGKTAINLRTMIYACQKTREMLSEIKGEHFIDGDIEEELLLSNIAYSFNIQSGKQVVFGENLYLDPVAGAYDYPLFKASYDYVKTHQFDIDCFKKCCEERKKQKNLSSDAIVQDSDYQILQSYHRHPEEKVLDAINSISTKLDDGRISVGAYGKLAFLVVQLEGILELDFSGIKDKLKQKIKGVGNDISPDEVFMYVNHFFSEREQKNYLRLREEMIVAMYDGIGISKDKKYAPKSSSEFVEWINQKEQFFNENKGCLRYVDTAALAEVFLKSSPQEMDDIRTKIEAIYRPLNISDIFDEKEEQFDDFIELLRDSNTDTLDKIQLLQVRLLINNLESISERFEIK